MTSLVSSAVNFVECTVHQLKTLCLWSSEFDNTASIEFINHCALKWFHFVLVCRKQLSKLINA